MQKQAIFTALVAFGPNIGLAGAECAHNNLIRCLIRHKEPAISFCSSAVGILPTASTVTITSTVGPV